MSDDAERHKDIESLEALRDRLGHDVVDELQDREVLSGAPMSSDVRALAQELLAWEPSIPRSADLVTPSVERIQPKQMLSENVPAALLRLSNANSGITSACQDGTGASLVALAQRAYAAFVAASNPRQNRAGWSPMLLRQTDEHRNASAAMRAELCLASLWQPGDILTSFSRTDPRPYDPVELLLHGAWRLCLLRGDWSVSAFFGSVLEQLERLRSSGKGEPTTVPVFLGFGDVQPAAATVRGTTHARAYRGRLQSWLLEPSDRLDTQGGGIIVERSYPWMHCVVNAGEELGADRGLPAGALSADESSSFRRWADCVAVAIGLSQTPMQLRPHALSGQHPFTPAPRLRWLLTGDPLYGATSHHFSLGWRAAAECPRVELNAQTLEQADELYAIEDTSTRTAIHRLCAALERPRAWRDGLVDAVIAWEAMSGDCSNAVVVKVSAIMAHLASDPMHRSQVRDKIRKIYKARSNVVHGGDERVSETDRDAAVLVGLTALRRLVQNYQHLLGSNERFEKLCLDPP